MLSLITPLSNSNLNFNLNLLENGFWRSTMDRHIVHWVLSAQVRCSYMQLGLLILPIGDLSDYHFAFFVNFLNWK
jgi:elongation factor P hydroxylase